MNKQETLRHISDLVEMQEKAIQQHPAETAALYVRGRDAFIEGQRGVQETEWSRAMSLTLDELSVMHRYMLSSSFISAWYHLAGDKANRDKAAHSCSILVSSLGLEPKDVMKKYVEYEQLWRQTMAAEGIAPHRIGPIALVVVLTIVVVILVIILGKYLRLG